TRKLFRVLALRICGTRQETAELSPLFHHWAAAFFANFVRGDLLSFQVLHVLGGFLEILFKFLVEVVESLHPRHLAFFDFVEFLFHASRVLRIEDVFEMADEHIRNDGSQLGGAELPLVLKTYSRS